MLYGVNVLKAENSVEITPKGPKVSIIQGNIPQHEKWNDSIKEVIFQKYEGLTRQVALERPDLIIWPETAFPGYWEHEPQMRLRFQSMVRDLGTRFLIGAPTFREGPDGLERMNTAIYFGPQGRDLGRYYKLRLVPFGEYVPSFSFLRHFFDIGRFTAGEKMVLFEMPFKTGLAEKIRFGVLICFEDIFPDLCRKFVQEGSRVLVNITNDAWFQKTSAPYQHAQASVFRAIENRVPVIRVANTGLSCFIDPSGRIVETVHDKHEELFITGYLTRRISLGKNTSFYTRWGDVFIVFCILITFLTIPIYLTKSKNSFRMDSSDLDD